MSFTWDFVDQDKYVYLIHDNSGEYKYADYDCYNIKDVPISANAPNMNPYAERFIGSIRGECFDWFVLFNDEQIRKLASQYIAFFNTHRPHQGIEQQIPKGYVPQKEGKIVSVPVLSGLVHHYERKAA